MNFSFQLSQKLDIKKISVRITLPNDKINIRTSLKIDPKEWDYDKQRPKNIYLKKHKILNNKLNQIKVSLAEYIEQKKSSKRQLSNIVHKICIEEPIALKNGSLLFYMKSYIQTRKELICNSTYKRYNVFFNLLQRFEGYNLKTSMIDEINAEFVKDFIIFAKEETYSEATIYRTIHFIKTILNFIEKKGIRTAVKEIEVRRERQYKEVVTLTENEILKIKATDVPQKLQAAKDWLVISCYTGQRFSDFINFTTEKLIDVDNITCINFIQQKTQKEILLPLHPTVLNVIRRNKNSFPPPLNIHSYNQEIKQIAKINYHLQTNKRIGHRVKKLLFEKWETITSHIGRRSFATNFYGKIPTPLLMGATGHSTESMFLKYIKPIDSERVISLSHHFDKMYQEKLISLS